MTFPLDDIVLGPASFGRLHRLDLLIGHTGEEPGFSRDHAVATAIWQRTNPGSYSFRIYDRASDPRGVMLNVPWLEASGGINPGSAAWAPERHPWIEKALAKAGECPVAGCAGPYRNPTMHAGQISFTGRRDQLDAGKAPPNYLPDAERLIAWYEHHPLRGPAPLVVVMHGHLQSNRSDWGLWMQSRLAPQEDELATLETARPVINRQVLIGAGATARSTPAYDPHDPDGNRIVVHAAAHWRPVIFETDGTDLRGPNGEVYNAGRTWLACSRQEKPGFVYYHAQDESGRKPIELAPDPAAVYQAADDVARAARRTADAYRP